MYKPHVPEKALDVMQSTCTLVVWTPSVDTVVKVWKSKESKYSTKVHILKDLNFCPFGWEFPHYEIMSCHSVWTLPSSPKQWSHWQHFLVVCLPLCHFKDLMHNCRYYIANFLPCRAIDVLQPRKSLRADNALSVLAWYLVMGFL